MIRDQPCCHRSDPDLDPGWLRGTMIRDQPCRHRSDPDLDPGSAPGFCRLLVNRVIIPSDLDLGPDTTADLDPAEILLPEEGSMR